MSYKWISALLLSAFALAGCLDVQPPDGTLACSTNGACPTGYQCKSDLRCWRSGGPPDLGSSPGGADLAGGSGGNGPTCSDGQKNAGESDVDCGGGSCPACALGQSCVAAGDCQSGECDATHHCAADSCHDGVKDGSESAVDCGGSCAKCSNGLGCASAVDCQSGVCSSATQICVASTCTDGTVDGGETDVDCGGSACGGCAPGQHCAVGHDCLSGACSATNRCVASQCSDGIQDGNETDIDCGGGTCTACVKTRKCQLGSDCTSGFCSAVSHTCVDNQCQDGAKDGSETDVDCGGGTCSTCTVNQRCNDNADCASASCSTAHLCVSTQCMDGVKDGSETDVDCGGGTCPACPVGQGCAAGRDCSSTFCNGVSHQCVADECHDGSRDGSETDVDCGGSCATKCATGLDCQSGLDCVSSWCNGGSHLCVSSHCQDASKDGSGGEAETDVDCGGTVCGPCAVNKGCASAADCATASCWKNSCALQTATPSWLPVTSMPAPAESGAAVADFSGKIYYLMGVYTASGGVQSSGEVYTPAPASSWSTSIPVSPHAVWGYGAALGPDGNIYYAGGNVGSSPTDEKTVTGYNPTSNSWFTTTPALTQPRRYDGMATALGRVFVFGGLQTSTPLDEVESWAPGDAAWKTMSPLPATLQSCSAATTPDNRVLVYATPKNGAYIYDPSADKWLGETAAASDIHSTLLTAPDGRIYAVGGQTVEAYVAAIDKWVPVASLGTPRSASAAIGGDGRIYALGGDLSGSVAPLQVAEAYGPIISTSATGGARGGSFTVSGSNFAALAAVSVYFDAASGTALATTTSNGAGVMPSTAVTVPSTLTVGPHKLIVVDAKSQYPAFLQPFNVN